MPDRFELGVECAQADRLVTIYRTFFQTTQEVLGGLLAGGVPVEEEESLGVCAGQNGTENIVVGGGNNPMDILATARAGAGEHELADDTGVGDDHVLGDKAAHRESENIDLAVAQAGNKPVGVLGGGFDGGGNLTGGGTHALLVKGNDVAVVAT